MDQHQETVQGNLNQPQDIRRSRRDETGNHTKQEDVSAFTAFNIT